MSILARNNVQIRGDGVRTIVLAHGFGCDSTMWDAQLPALCAQFRVIVLDHVGAGDSDVTAYSPHRYQTLRSYAMDLIEVLQALDVTGSTYVGHSMSGMIGILAQIETPQLFQKMIFIGASPRYLNDPYYIGGFERTDVDALYEAMRSNFYAWASGFAPIAMQNADRPALTEQFAKTLTAMRPDVALGIARVIFESDHRQDLAKIGVPTLVLQGRNDVAVPMQVGEFIARNIPGAKLEMLDATGHFPPISAPSEVTRAILNFA